MNNVLTYEALKTERDALAVENAELSAALSLISGSYGLSPHIQSICAVETPATDAALAAIEARVWEEAKDFSKSMLATDSADHIDFLFDGKIKQLREAK
ncbi:hypothetical protein AB6825_22775 [Serratia proteamaculans]|uniref:hypothetical protein n=1 Tax=Serratia proteamaculans TaxID=28151 RepID=UPI0039BE9FED